MSLREVLSASDYLASLTATRDAIADDLDACESMRDRAALYLRLSDVLVKIESAKPPAVRGDAVDEIARRRAARKSGAGEDPARTDHTG